MTSKSTGVTPDRTHTESILEMQPLPWTIIKSTKLDAPLPFHFEQHGKRSTRVPHMQSLNASLETLDDSCLHDWDLYSFKARARFSFTNLKSPASRTSYRPISCSPVVRSPLKQIRPEIRTELSVPVPSLIDLR